MAAGQGYIEFATGDVLTAAAANGYLASQVVMVFASAAARTSAIASPQEGMISYLKDTNSTEYYSGSAWVAIGGGASGGMTLLQTLDLSGVATVTSSSIAGTYNNLVFVIKDVYFPGGTNATLGMRFNSDTGNNYTYRGFFQQGAGTASGDDATNAAQHSILDAASSTGKDAGQGSVIVYRYTDTSGVISQTNTYGHINGPTTRAYSRTNYYNGASAISTVTFFYVQGGGNWSNGTIYVYGVS